MIFILPHSTVQGSLIRNFCKFFWLSFSHFSTLPQTLDLLLCFNKTTTLWMPNIILSAISIKIYSLHAANNHLDLEQLQRKGYLSWPSDSLWASPPYRCLHTFFIRLLKWTRKFYPLPFLVMPQYLLVSRRPPKHPHFCTHIIYPHTLSF